MVTHHRKNSEGIRRKKRERGQNNKSVDQQKLPQYIGQQEYFRRLPKVEAGCLNSKIRIQNSNAQKTPGRHYKNI